MGRDSRDHIEVNGDKSPKPSVGSCDDVTSPCGFNWLALAGFATIFVCIVFIGTGLDKIMGFWDTPAAAIVFGIVAGGLLIAHGRRLPDGTILFFELPRIVGGRIQNDEEAELATEALGLGAELSILAGAIGTMIGWINMLGGGADDPNALTAGAAVSLLTMFYAVIAAAFFLMARNRVWQCAREMRQRFDESVDKKKEYGLASPPKMTLSKLGIFIIFAVVLLEAGFFLLFSLLQPSNTQLTLTNDTSNEWVVYGSVVYAEDQGDGKRSLRKEQVYPSLLIPHGESSYGWSTLEDQPGRPTKVVLVIGDKDGALQKRFEIDWPSGADHHTISLSQYMKGFMPKELTPVSDPAEIPAPAPIE